MEEEERKDDTSGSLASIIAIEVLPRHLVSKCSVFVGPDDTNRLVACRQSWEFLDMLSTAMWKPSKGKFTMIRSHHVLRYQYDIHDFKFTKCDIRGYAARSFPNIHKFRWWRERGGANF